MKNKIDVGVFVKNAFESVEQPYQPNEKVLERIHKTLDKPKRKKNKILFWFSFSVLLISTVSYLVIDTYSNHSQRENRQITANSYVKKQSIELSQEEVFGPKLYSDLLITNKDSLSTENTTNVNSFIIDTTLQNFTRTETYEVRVNLGNTSYDIDQDFNQKTIYHYYRASDSLRIQTKDKKIIDSIMSHKKSSNSIDYFQ